MSHILALDIGTSSVRAAIYDFQANVLPETMVKKDRTVHFTEDGGAELTAQEAFSQVCEAIEEVLSKSSQTIDYVAASCFWHSLVGIDSKGNATTNVFTWAETRPAKYVQTLRDNLNETQIHNRTGARFHSSFWTAKLLWLKAEFPDTFQKTDKWLSFSDYLAFKLFGKNVTSVSMASGTGLFNVRRFEWDDDLLTFTDIKSECLPEIVEDGATFHTSRWEKLKNAKWFLAIGDGAANNVGAGCLQKTKAALMIGTSGAMRVAYEGEIPKQIPSGLWCYRIDRKKVIVGGALSDGGGLYRWLKDNLKLKGSDDDIETQIAKREPDSHGLTFLPFFAGERSTGYHENAKGAILGLTQHTNAVEITQAAMESIAFRFAEIFEELQQIVDIKTIIASGGALRESPVWTQIIADTLGQDLSLPDTHEASSRGVVLLALEQIGKLDNISELPTPEGNKFNFSSEKHGIYQQARKRHDKFYELILSNPS